MLFWIEWPIFMALSLLDTKEIERLKNDRRPDGVSIE
jgi:hypothetical protein